jgi:hypothetical protein
MKNTPSVSQILGRGNIVLFVKVAAHAGIDKIIVAVIAAKPSGPEVVYRQFTGNIVLAHAGPQNVVDLLLKIVNTGQCLPSVYGWALAPFPP